MEWKKNLENLLVYAIIVDDVYFKDMGNIEKFFYVVYIKKPIILFTYEKSFLPVNLILDKIDNLKIVNAQYKDLLCKEFISNEINNFISDLIDPIPGELMFIN